MCPTFIATHDEVMSTRGRANIIRAALELRTNGHDPLKSAELDAALSNCLSCKGCTPECPSNVNLALLKAEMLHARWRRDGLPLRERILSNVDLLGKLGCLMPRLTNRLLGFKAARIAMEKTIGISARRSLPHYASERFDKWFSRHCRASVSDATNKEGRSPDRPGGYKPPLLGNRGKVILWDDTFVRYHEPHIGIAAVKVLEALGFEVALVKNRRCCGRPAFSQGNLDAAAKLAKHNISQLSTAAALQLSTAPILFLEPSCWSMFVEDYRELKIENAENIAGRCFLFEKFVADLLAQEPEALRFKERVGERPHPPALSCQIDSQSGVHGHAGRTFAWKKSHGIGHSVLRNGRRIRRARRKIRSIAPSRATLARSNRQSTPRGTEVIASGTSCRHQITDLTKSPAKTHGRVARRSDRMIASNSGRAKFEVRISKSKRGCSTFTPSATTMKYVDS